MLLNTLNRNDNPYMDKGELDAQIIADHEAFLEELHKKQERLDKDAKDSHSYQWWTETNQKLIRYTERIIECVKVKS